MKGHTAVAAALLAAFLLATSAPGWAQAKMWMTPAEVMAALKPGQWVKMEGSLQKDLTVWCTEIKILTGDFLDDDWSICTIVKKTDPEKQQSEMMQLPVSIQKDAEYQGDLKSFADVKARMLLDVDGTYLKDGTFLATQVEDKSIELEENPEKANEVEVKGKVDKIDAAKSTVTIMGITFRINEKTKSRSVIK